MIKMKNSFKLDVQALGVFPLLLVLCGNICGVGTLGVENIRLSALTGDKIRYD